MSQFAPEPVGMLSGTNRGLDGTGFIRPEVALDRVIPPYLPVVDDLRARCRVAFAEDLHGLYLNGSVVKGTARPGVSDLDALAVLRVVPDAEHLACAGEVAQSMEKRHPFLAGVTLALYHGDAILSRGQRYDMGFFIKCLCACVDGEDLAALLPRYRPSLALARGTNGDIGQLLDDRRERLKATEDPDAVAFICQGIMRKIIRTGFTLVMPRYRGWTSDLDRSVAIFTEFYPGQADAMRSALHLARTPSKDRHLVTGILDSFGVWLTEEYDRVIMQL